MSAAIKTDRPYIYQQSGLVCVECGKRRRYLYKDGNSYACRLCLKLPYVTWNTVSRRKLMALREINAESLLARDDRLNTSLQRTK